jgi:hypothetical protein
VSTGHPLHAHERLVDRDHRLVLALRLDDAQLEAGVDGGLDQGDHLVGPVPHVLGGEGAAASFLSMDSSSPA